MTTNKDWIESSDGKTFSLRSVKSKPRSFGPDHITRETLLTLHYTKDERFTSIFTEYNWDSPRKGILTRLFEAIFPYGVNQTTRGETVFSREQMIALGDWVNERMYSIEY